MGVSQARRSEENIQAKGKTYGVGGGVGMGRGRGRQSGSCRDEHELDLISSTTE